MQIFRPLRNSAVCAVPALRGSRAEKVCAQPPGPFPLQVPARLLRHSSAQLTSTSKGGVAGALHWLTGNLCWHYLCVLQGHACLHYAAGREPGSQAVGCVHQ